MERAPSAWREVRHWHQAPEERSRLVRTSLAPAAGQPVCASERPQPSGDFGVPLASQRCHLPPTAHPATKLRQKLHCIKMHFPPPGWGISPKCYNIHSTKECLETFFQTKPSRIQGFHIFKICYVGEIAMKLSKMLNF